MRAQIAASSGRFALNREIPVCARLRGGGRSRYRTGLRHQVLGNREKYRENPRIFTEMMVTSSSNAALMQVSGDFRGQK
jgi:hypothetical protein